MANQQTSCIHPTSQQPALPDHIDVECFTGIAAANLKAIDAMLDAVAVLCALEWAPVHQDSHPGHDVRTGGGYAQGRRLDSDTLPELLQHARRLASDVGDDIEEFFERFSDVGGQS